MVAVLRAEAVGYDYPGGIRALQGVDLAVRAGELVAVIGPNGSGKSTLLRVLAGLLCPKAGRVWLGGTALDQLGHRRRARAIALVPQGLAAIPEVRVRDFVTGGRYAHLGFWRARSTTDRAAVDRALGEAKATAWNDRLLGELSGGERQRVMIARALAQESDLLLFDEPTASLDPEHQLLVMQQIADLAARGKTVVVVTHDFNLASQFAERIVLLDEGCVQADGEPAEVLRAAVLEPVYGESLLFLQFPAGGPMVVPRRAR